MCFNCCFDVDIATVSEGTPPENVATWGDTVRRVARTSIDAAMWITPAAMTTVRYGTEVYAKLLMTRNSDMGFRK